MGDGSLDEVEDKLEKERKARGDLDKVKRKLETELKQTNSMVEDLERVKKGLEETVRRKDVESNDLILKLEGEQGWISDCKENEGDDCKIGRVGGRTGDGETKQIE